MEIKKIIIQGHEFDLEHIKQQLIKYHSGVVVYYLKDTGTIKIRIGKNG